MSGGRYQGTRITEPPTLTGAAGSAWRVRMPPPGQRAQPQWDGTVDGFILHAPGCHPLWNHWTITVIHLRPIAGVPPADIRVAGATHELLIATLDPGQPLPGLDAGADTYRTHVLRPLDVCQQFAVPDDASAAAVLELAVTAIVNGQASPDQDWRAWWAQAITATAAHYREGRHRVNRA